LKYLGLYKQRRVALKLISERIINEHNGAVPLNEAALISLPHIGRYISNAVLCFCQGQKRPIVDSNIARVIVRFHGIDMPKDTREKWIWDLANKMLPDKKWIQYNYGIIDIGALFCKTQKPICQKCCLEDLCVYYKLHINNHT
jgi:A/G-specific adenine glycosylase